MKILRVHNRYLYTGGEDEVFAAEGALLRRQGHTVVEYVEDNRNVRQMAKAAVAAGALWSHPAAKHLRKMLHRYRPTVAHFHNTFPLISPAAYYACRSTGTPVVQTLHNYRLLCAGSNFFRDGRVCELCLGRRLTWPGTVHRCYHRSVAQSTAVTAMLGLHRLLGTWERQVDLYIALSEFARNKFIQGGLPRDRIVVKPNFVEPDPGGEVAQGGYALYAGRLSPEKGVPALLQAWRRLPKVPLYIAGDGPLLGQVRESAASEAARGNVRVLGRCCRADLFGLMRAARFLVTPSQCYENFPMVIAEAFACGLPVITSNLGATAEIVEHERTGLLVRPKDPADLAEKVAWLWSHPAACRRMRRAARAEFESKYSAQSNYPRLLEIYRIALEGQSRRQLP
jgi:glycosyltransferase involved in cell wall biosynthesis